jgi:thiosulfate dehydrogenase
MLSSPKYRYTIAIRGRSSMKCCLLTAAGVLVLTSACSSPPPPGALRYKLNGPLVPARMTMVTAWDYPSNPLTDPSLDDSKLSKEIRWGYRIFTNTPGEASQFAPGRGSCNNCHLNGGQRERALPLVGIAGQFPEYNRRAGRLISLGDRIVDCFLRSQNATGRLAVENDGHVPTESLETLPSPTSREVLAVSAYLTWLSSGYQVGKNLAWRGQNTIANNALLAIEKADPQKGEAIFTERCTSCHGVDGQGVAVGDKRPGPLWGPNSWNDGAGAARIYTLAGIIRYTMPYLDPGNVTDEDAQHLAAFITSKPRPSYPFKDQDYLVEKVPVDSVYYPKR